MKYTISTEIIIKASSNSIWKVLTSQEEHPEWNPFLTKMEGNLREGNHLNIVAGGMSFKPKVLVVQPNRELRWLGKLLVKGLFDGEHIFRIEELQGGKCKFIHEENFSGILVRAFKKKLQTETKAGFQAMNEALKARTESLNFVTT